MSKFGWLSIILEKMVTPLYNLWLGTNQYLVSSGLLIFLENLFVQNRFILIEANFNFLFLKIHGGPKNKLAIHSHPSLSDELVSHQSPEQIKMPSWLVAHLMLFSSGYNAESIFSGTKNAVF